MTARTMMTEKELLEMLNYLADAPATDRIDMARRTFEPQITINDEEFALYVFDSVIKPHVENEIRLELARLHLN